MSYFIFTYRLFLLNYLIIKIMITKKDMKALHAIVLTLSKDL